MKSYKRPEIEVIDIQISKFCDVVNPSSYEIENPSQEGGLTDGNIVQGEIYDDL